MKTTNSLFGSNKLSRHEMKNVSGGNRGGDECGLACCDTMFDEFIGPAVGTCENSSCETIYGSDYGLCQGVTACTC